MEDVQIRPATIDDVPAVGNLVRAAEAHDGVPRVLSDDELIQDFSASYIDVEQDVRVAVAGGAVVGWLYVWNPPSHDRLERADLLGEVAPEHRGRGIGRALLGWGVDRARARLTARTHGLPRYIRVNAYDWLEDRHHLYRRLGFEAVRWHDELIRTLDEVPSLVVPAGIRLIDWPADRDEETRAVRNAAFGDHWGSGIVEPELWHDFLYGHGSRPDLSVVALDDAGEIVGLCVNQSYPEDEEVTGRRDGWIANIATLRAARGRGIASAMITCSLAKFAAADLTHALLDVDSENPTGAARLYRNLGFQPNHRSVSYQIEVA
jgi:mycothiol synthase